MNKLENFYRARFNLILLLVILGLIFFAWFNRFIQDDAFISFRYAYNFVHGKGLVWNEGERIEGYTNFLWTLLITLPLYLGLDPVTFVYALGLGFFFLSLILTYKLSLLVIGSRDLALLTVILLGANYTFSMYATGGLETQLQTCLFLAALYVFLHSLTTQEWRFHNLLALSFLLGAAMLTRLDSALLALIIFPVSGFYLGRQNVPRTEKLINGICLISPLLVLVGSWFWWKLGYYGDVLPNTFYAKVSSLTSQRQGLYYLGLFLVSYWLIPFPLLLVFAAKKWWKEKNRQRLILFTLILVWSFYVIAVGGDFMEFRLMVPILPCWFILVTWSTFNLFSQKKIQLILIALILLGSGYHIYMSSKFNTIGEIVATRGQLYGQLKNENEHWEKIGKVLGEAFNYDRGVKIATTTAGAIPYYSRLTFIDMYGINDKWVARNGDILGPWPGHQRMAPFSYLRERKVNLIMGVPLMVPRNSPFQIKLSHFRIFRREDIPPDSRLIKIPINQNYNLILFYFFKNPRVDEAIAKYGWEVYRVLNN